MELTDLCLLHLSFPNQPKCKLDLELPVPRTESLFFLAQFLYRPWFSDPCWGDLNLDQIVDEISMHSHVTRIKRRICEGVELTYDWYGNISNSQGK